MVNKRIPLFLGLLIVLSVMVCAVDYDRDGFEDGMDNCPSVENGGERDTLLEGESGVYTDGDVSYDVTLSFVDGTRAKFRINDEVTNLLGEGQTYVLQDTTVLLVTNVLYQSYAGGIHSATFYIGGQQDQDRDGIGDPCENQPPEFDDFPHSIEYLNEGDSSTFFVSIYDPEDDEVQVRWLLDDVEVSLTTEFVYNPSYDSAGTHEVEVRITDGEFTRNDYFKIEVQDVVSEEELEYTLLKAEFESIEDNYATLKRKLNNAFDDRDDNDLKRQKEKLEHLEDDLSITEGEVQTLLLKIKENSLLGNNFLDDVKDLEDDIGTTQEKIKDTLSIKEEINLARKNNPEPAVDSSSIKEESSVLIQTAVTVPVEKVVTSPIEKTVAVNNDVVSYSEIMPLILMGVAGVFSLVGVFLFLWFIVRR